MNNGRQASGVSGAGTNGSGARLRPALGWLGAGTPLPLFVGLACSLCAASLPKPDQVIFQGQRAVVATATNRQSTLTFASTSNDTEVVLQITHRDVTSTWWLNVNGHQLEAFPLSYRGPEESFFVLPPHTLVNGQNVLSVTGESPGRRMSFGDILLFRQPLRDLFKLRPVTVTVTDKANGQSVPARLTIVDGQGENAQIFHVAAPGGALRNGLFYTTGKETRFDLPEGRYEIYATRGMEWSLAHESLALRGDLPARVDLSLQRQVDTTGFVAADTHIHTVTFSGHGDATIEERMLTIAGEGVEFAVATDHNHQIDYRAYQAQQALNDFFTPVTGNEVTTRNGHLNAFPMPPGGAVPDYKESNWVKLVSDIRLKGARVVVLNHPRWPDADSNPFTRFAFNRATGDRPKGTAFTFDAMEIVNSSSPSTVDRDDLKTNRLNLFADWFAILNRGERITGVGASDSHTVFNPVGQGRTYIRSSTDDASQIKVDEVCGNFLAGDTSVSYGIFADAVVDGKHHAGETFQPSDGRVRVRLRVRSADWVRPRRAIVLLNGLPVAEKELHPEAGKAFDQALDFALKLPSHDAYLVCAVFGDPITEPFWRTVGKFTTAMVNPLYLDNDGDGQYSSPRDTARKILAATDGSISAVWEKISKSDDALAGQMIGLLYLERPADFVRELNSRLEAVAKDRPLYQTFLENSPLIVWKPKPRPPATTASK